MKEQVLFSEQILRLKNEERDFDFCSHLTRFSDNENCKTKIFVLYKILRFSNVFKCYITAKAKCVPATQG